MPGWSVVTIMLFVPGKDYYRMDGSTAADTRKIWCKYFNRTTSHR